MSVTGTIIGLIASFAAAKNDAKDREIAELRAQLAEANERADAARDTIVTTTAMLRSSEELVSRLRAELDSQRTMMGSLRGLLPGAVRDDINRQMEAVREDLVRICDCSPRHGRAGYLRGIQTIPDRIWSWR